MGIFYRVPISGVTWDRHELHEVIRSLFVRPAADGNHELAAYIEQHFGGQAVLVNSGRSALELALHRLREHTQQPHPSVLTPSLICRAVPDKIVATGFTPVFYDVSRDLSPSVESLCNAIRPDTAAVVFPYLYGKVVPAEKVAMMCKDAGLALIEDCAASFLLPHRQGCLSGTSGDYVIFSFQRGKTAVAGGGGALVDRTGTQDGYVAGNWTSWELRKLYFSKITFMLEEVFLRTGYLAQRTVGLDRKSVV
jgi:dTDP-4-amino-4,6-dideoxygalactose transaminase